MIGSKRADRGRCRLVPIIGENTRLLIPQKLPARDFTILEPISFPGSYLSQNAFLFSELRLQVS